MAKKLNFPTILTILRMILVVPFLIFLMVGWYWPALVIFVVAAVTDKIDGDMARKRKQVTDLGKFLDPLADKMLVNSAFLALAVMGIVPVWAFALILWRDFAVDGIRMMIARNGETVAASMWGKLKTTTQMVALVALMLNLIIASGILATVGTVLLHLALGLTLYSGADYLIKGWPKAIK